MTEEWKQIIWSQFGASIDMLENAITACPENIWDDGTRGFSSYWYMTFHTLFWLDYYLTAGQKEFAPPEPFTLDEFDPAGIIPERAYTRTELQKYLRYCREKCRDVIKNLTAENARTRCKAGSNEIVFAELLLDNMRHVQHHTAQLNLLLRQKIDDAPLWITKTKSPFEN
jgi:uncharacterized damage-inducible protein DinB